MSKIDIKEYMCVYVNVYISKILSPYCQLWSDATLSTGQSEVPFCKNMPLTVVVIYSPQLHLLNLLGGRVLTESEGVQLQFMRPTTGGREDWKLPLSF